MKREIEITIPPDGSITVEGHGFSGPECKQATAAIEAALGETTGTRQKAEFHQKAVVRQSSKN